MRSEVTVGQSCYYPLLHLFLNVPVSEICGGGGALMEFCFLSSVSFLFALLVTGLCDKVWDLPQI